MIPVEEFRKENSEIRELSNLLNHVVEDYSLINNSVVCELLDRFTRCVTQHLEHEDRSIYRDLMKKHTADADHLADLFLGNTRELKRIFNTYKRDWCKTPHKESDHQEYISESQQIFKMVNERLDFEENKIFPVFSA